VLFGPVTDLIARMMPGRSPARPESLSMSTEDHHDN
jgi:hypothetical protein